MTLEVFISREAHTDITVAVAGVGEISSTLSARFEVELERVYLYMSEYPEMYPVVYRNFRRALLRKFPYSVFYIVETSRIVVMGVIHQSRDESVWQSHA